MCKLNGLLIVLFFISCNSSPKDSFGLVASNDSLVFELNSQTSVFIKALFPYVDKNGKEYLTFQNNTEPEILWYDMDTQEYIKTIKLDREGMDGVGGFSGYYICSENEICIPEEMRNRIDIVNGEGKIIRKITYGKTSKGKTANPLMCLSFPYTPIYIIDKKFYLPQSPNMELGDRIVEDSPVTLILDSVNHSLIEFDLRFPKVKNSRELRGNSLGVEMSYSQTYNRENFIYSFFFDENIYVVSLDGQIQNKIKVKSQYVDKVYDGKWKVMDINALVRTLCEIPMYGNLIYDEYREVYYRFVYPKTELDSENYMDIWQLGRTKFSVIILNKNLEILGETLFPENTYASNHFFVRKEGLYISTSFVKNDNYSDDKLCFVKFNLIRK